MRSDVGVDIEHTESYKGFPSTYTITLMLDDVKELPSISYIFFFISQNSKVQNHKENYNLHKNKTFHSKFNILSRSQLIVLAYKKNYNTNDPMRKLIFCRVYISIFAFSHSGTNNVSDKEKINKWKNPIPYKREPTTANTKFIL